MANQTPIGSASNTIAAATKAITAGGTAQTIFAANERRKTFGYSNTSDQIQYVSHTGTAVALEGIAVAPGATIILGGADCPRGAISVIGATTGKTFYAWEGV